MKTNMPFEDSGHEPLPPANLIVRHPKGTGARVLLTSVFGPTHVTTSSVVGASIRWGFITTRAGHVAALADIGFTVDADHFVRGDGISWMRRYLGQEGNAPVPARSRPAMQGVPRGADMPFPATEGR